MASLDGPSGEGRPYHRYGPRRETWATSIFSSLLDCALMRGMGDLFWLYLPWLFLLYLALFTGLCCVMSLVERDSKSGATAAHAVSTPPRPPKPRLRQSYAPMASK